MQTKVNATNVKTKLTLAAALVLFQSAAPAFAAERPMPDPAGYAKRFWGDLKELPKKPGTWSKD